MFIYHTPWTTPCGFYSHSWFSIQRNYKVFFKLLQQSFFSSPSFLPMTFVYICSENALHISGFYFMQLATYERRVLDSLCSPLIHCWMQSKRTDYCKVRTEVLNLFPGENSAQISWNPWVLPLFNIPNVMTCHFFDGRQGDKPRETNNNFFRKFKYNLLIETIWGQFSSSLYASLLSGLFRLRVRS